VSAGCKGFTKEREAERDQRSIGLLAEGKHWTVTGGTSVRTLSEKVGEKPIVEKVGRD